MCIGLKLGRLGLLVVPESPLSISGAVHRAGLFSQLEELRFDTSPELAVCFCPAERLPVHSGCLHP